MSLDLPRSSKEASIFLLVPSKGGDFRRYLQRVGTFEGTFKRWGPSKVPLKVSLTLLKGSGDVRAGPKKVDVNGELKESRSGMKWRVFYHKTQ